MCLYQCHCGFGSATGAYAVDIINHVRGCHYIDVRTGQCHFAHCNDCPRQNGHGKRLEDMDQVIEHLSDRHGIEIDPF
jgi:hypothetical protein